MMTGAKQRKPMTTGFTRNCGPRLDEWAARTWDQVADEFNQRHGTNLTIERIRQIGSGAVKKIRGSIEREISDVHH